jgi:hypothetical protein
MARTTVGLVGAAVGLVNTSVGPVNTSGRRQGAPPARQRPQVAGHIAGRREYGGDRHVGHDVADAQPDQARVGGHTDALDGQLLDVEQRSRPDHQDVAVAPGEITVEQQAELYGGQGLDDVRRHIAHPGQPDQRHLQRQPGEEDRETDRPEGAKFPPVPAEQGYDRAVAAGQDMTVRGRKGRLLAASFASAVN